MLYEMRVPSENMKLSVTELAKMTHDQQVANYLNDKEKQIHEEAALARDRELYGTTMRDYAAKAMAKGRNKAEFLQNVKESFLIECLSKIYKESSVTPLTKRDRTVARNLITHFVKENGANALLQEFATKNYLLSEVARICRDNYQAVVESLDVNSPVTNMADAVDYNLDTTIRDNFYDELEKLDTEDAAGMIRDRVSDAITNFIDDNSAAKMEIQDLIQTAQEKAQKAPTEEIAESLIAQAKRATNTIRNSRPKNVFNLMVESLTRKALTDEAFKARYVNESQVDMESVVDDTTLIYTMLEMVNTTNMVNVDGEFIEKYLKSIA